MSVRLKIILKHWLQLAALIATGFVIFWYSKYLYLVCRDMEKKYFWVVAISLVILSIALQVTIRDIFAMWWFMPNIKTPGDFFKSHYNDYFFFTANTISKFHFSIGVILFLPLILFLDIFSFLWVLIFSIYYIVHKILAFRIDT